MTTVTSMQIALTLNLGLDVTALMVSLEMELHVQVKIKHALISHQRLLCELFGKAQSDKTTRTNMTQCKVSECNR